MYIHLFINVYVHVYSRFFGVEGNVLAANVGPEPCVMSKHVLDHESKDFVPGQASDEECPCRTTTGRMMHRLGLG